ncbi:unnamed protein product [Paramecium sonneborni]|uniref:Uncharacterized protein n=1 Tax=Paramecium sonneborni TaxID=65129 RepID=A0A8S1QZ99_9CILI|nr:unnamed protein product [Paramecium sonneborni]CAD8120308.1 unnamed protein product [Paramecium sonneborni]
MFFLNKNEKQEILKIKNIGRENEREQKIMLNLVDEVKKQNGKYMKVSQQKKQQLCQMVQREGKKIKEAARILGIKYPTAKTIVFHKRKQRKQKGKTGIRMCGYTEVMEKRVIRLQIISITGNDAKQCKEYTL